MKFDPKRKWHSVHTSDDVVEMITSGNAFGPRAVTRPVFRTVLKQEVRKWIDENIGTNSPENQLWNWGADLDGYRFYFYSKEHAIHFKLTWGDGDD